MLFARSTLPFAQLQFKVDSGVPADLKNAFISKAMFDQIGKIHVYIFHSFEKEKDHEM